MAADEASLGQKSIGNEDGINKG